MRDISIPEAITILRKEKPELLAHLRKASKTSAFNYRNFGTAIEEHLVEVIIQVLTKSGIIKSQADYQTALGKNDFPDFLLKTRRQVAIDFKVGNRSQLRDGKWVSVKNSENDLGTLREWPKKIKKFGGENIYFIFVIYNFNDKSQEIIDIQIGPFYQFVGLLNSGMLKYRKKDGNLRPKDFDAEPPIKTLNQFSQLLNKTNIYRSTSIIEEHRNIIEESTKNL